MENTNLKLVKLKRSVLGHRSKYQLVHDVLEVLNTIHNLDALKNDPEFLLLVCNLVENSNEETELNKKEIVLEVFKSLFAELNNEQDLKKISDMVDFLRSNKRIKKVSTVMKYLSKFSSWVLKKIS